MDRTHRSLIEFPRVDSFVFSDMLRDMVSEPITVEGSKVSLYRDRLVIDGERGEIVCRFSFVKSGFGGRPRVFFRCPICGGRCRYLYLNPSNLGGYAACRKCARGNYPSQTVTRGLGQELIRIRSFLRDIFNEACDDLSAEELTIYVPKKPRGMHHVTYYKSLAALEMMQGDLKLSVLSASTVLAR